MNESKTKKKKTHFHRIKHTPELTLELKYKPYFVNFGPHIDGFSQP